MKRVLTAIIAFFAFATVVNAQVGVYPQATFIDPATRSAIIRVLNNSESTKEITIDLKYGYPGYDVMGKTAMVYNDSTSEMTNSLIPYLKVFPKKLLLKAKEEQVVRFMVNNVNDLKDGLYFTRVVVTSKDPAKQIDSTFKSDEIQARIDLQFSVIGVVLFKKGEPTCQVNVKGAKTFTDSTGLYLQVNYERSGEAPFLGTTVVKAFAQNGDLVQEIREVSPIYFNCVKSFKFDSAKFTTGLYNFEINMTNEHKDVPKEYKIPFDPYIKTVSAPVVSQ